MGESVGCVLSVYSQNAYKEYLLPAVIDADYELILHKDLFGLQENLSVSMENLDGKWRFRTDQAYILQHTDTGKSAIGDVLEDKYVLTLQTARGELLNIIVTMTSRFFGVYDKFLLHPAQDITIGKNENSVLCYDYRNIISGLHAVIRRDSGTGYCIEDRSHNGTFVNSRRITGTRHLVYGDLISIYGLSLVYLGECLAVESDVENLVIDGKILRPVAALDFGSHIRMGGDGVDRRENVVHLFHRAPRYYPELETEKEEIEAPPAPKEDNNRSLLLTIGPSMTMALPMLLGCGLAIYSARTTGNSGVFMYTGLVTAVSSATLGTIWALVNINQEKKRLREDALKRFELYGEYLINCGNRIKEKYEKNTITLRKLYDTPEECCTYDYHSSKLWNRNKNQEDFLRHRIGMGDMPFQVEISIPKEKFTMINDSLAEKPKLIKETYATLHEVPICVDLENNPLIGIVGGSGKQGCYTMAYDLIAQIAASNSYTDVKLGFIVQSRDQAGEDRWAFAKWLPHAWSGDKRLRFMADNKNDASDVFFELVRNLRERAEEHTKKNGFKPHYVLFVEDASLFEGELITKYLFDNEKLGITVILLAEGVEELPNSCEYVIENTGNFQGVYRTTDTVDARLRVQLDHVREEQLDLFARKLSNIRVQEIESGGELPSTLTFFDMYGIHKPSELQVEERWKKNRTYESIKGLLGVKAGNSPCYLDVHEKYHGPHGLVAGTTGSGKSETLQTYILSLSVNYSPDDVGFFVIDYKGGGMANLFSDLPHLIGQISNLSGNQVRRAMISIKSENVRRQKIFNEYGVNNINSYTKLYKNKEAAVPIPHLFIIIDEFAELKREEPDFMKELISVAQVGRSLGVHLILATQKPSGTVDDNIWSNSKFRLCLRVQDKADSKDMLHRPDAAYITQAGRCYLQVGNDELFELFQSGWSGAIYDEEEAGSGEDTAQMLSQTGKAALTGNHMKLVKKEYNRKMWICTLIRLLEATGWSREEIQRCADNPIQQRHLIEEFFVQVQKEQIEFPYSDYNVRCVSDFILLYGQALRTDINEREEGLASYIIKSAAKAGKKLPEQKEKTQLEAVVEYLKEKADYLGYHNVQKLWMPVLPEEIYLEQLEGYSQNAFDGTGWKESGKQWTLEAYVGLFDDPENQRQMPMTVDLAENGHHAILGTVVSGKSTFMLTLLYSLISRYTPEEINIYALDYSSKMLSAIEGAAHVGGVMYENDDEKVGKFFTMMEKILKERKRLLRGGNYSQYIQAQRGQNAAAEQALPAIIIAVDNYSAFNARTNGAYAEFLMQLSKEGVACGIFLVVTAAGFSASEIPGRLGENFRTVICLEMNDTYAYTEALRMAHLDVLPEENVRGRGIARAGENFLEFQTALPLPAEDDFQRIGLIQEKCRQMNQAWKKEGARRIPEIPEKPVWKEYELLPEVNDMQKAGMQIPMGYDQKTAAIYGLPLEALYTWIISGKKRTGKTNLLRIMAAAAAGMDAQIVLIDFAQELQLLAGKIQALHITSDQELYDRFIELQPEFVKRNVFKKQCTQNGDTDEEIFEKMQQYQKIFIFIADLPEFVEHIARPQQGVGNMSGFVANLLDKGANHNVYWFAAYNQDDALRVAGQQVYELFVKGQKGIHLGGNVMGQRLLNFDHIKYSDQSKLLPPGIGLLPAGSGETSTVVIPLYKA